MKGGLGLLDIFYDVTYNQADKRAVNFRLRKGLRTHLRKYVVDENEKTHRNKRVCEWDIRPSEIKDNDTFFAIKRMTLEELVADYVDGDEL